MSLTSTKEIVRATGIGSSDAAAVAGFSRWRTLWDVFATKHGLIGPQEQTESMFWGKRLERVIAEVFSERMNLPIEWCDRRIYSTKRPWQYASPDALILTEPRQVLECKTAGIREAREWDDEASNEDGVPVDYWAQVEWQMSTLGLASSYVAVLIGGQDFRIYRIEHDPAFEEVLLEAAEEFWRRHILAREEPPIGGSERARRYLRQRFPRERVPSRPATVTEADWLNQYVQLKTLLKTGEERKEELENQICQAVAEHQGLTWPRGELTWKRTKDRRTVNWRGLGEEQIASFPEDRQKEIVQRYTHLEPGYRRIHVHEEALA